MADRSALPAEARPKQRRSAFGRALDVLALIAMVSLAVSATWAAAVRHDQAGYHIGDRFDAREYGSPDTAGPALILWIESTCGACQDSAIFYKKLSVGEHITRVVVITPEPVEQMKEFLKKYSIEANYVVSTQGSWLRFKGTPTLMKVDIDGAIRQIWFGRLGRSGEKDVISAVN